MTARSTLSAIRFGYGRRPGVTDSGEAADMLATVASASKEPATASLRTRADVLAALQDARKNNGDVESKTQALRAMALDDLRHFVGLALDGAGFGERLVAFWADHFTVAATNQRLAALAPDFLQSAIRPNVGGRFENMLIAALTHPAMLIYLDQSRSVGPNSPNGKNSGRGLNENLARELLELHTVGVDGSYTQTDVRNLALVLTGLSIDRQGFKFRPGIAEPGKHVVLGSALGGERKNLDDIREALRAIARHPETARHIAQKLVVHFVGAPADPDLVRSLELAYRNSEGRLTEVYRALLTHEAAWGHELKKVKTPFEFIISALRASGVGRDFIEGLTAREVRQGILRPLTGMGQAPLRPAGPDGWSEDPSSWITPPLLAERIRWAGGLAERIAPEQDPREFLSTALGDAASEKLAFAVNGAESRVEGIALTLVSPEFNRR